MKLKDFSLNRALIELSLDELFMLHSSLNEVCHGFHIHDFETRIGVSKNELIFLMKNLEKTIKELEKTDQESLSKMVTILDEHWLLCPNCSEVWECASQEALVICPKCDKAFRNPRCIES